MKNYWLNRTRPWHCEATVTKVGGTDCAGVYFMIETIQGEQKCPYGDWKIGEIGSISKSGFFCEPVVGDKIKIMRATKQESDISGIGYTARIMSVNDRPIFNRWRRLSTPATRTSIDL